MSVEEHAAGARRAFDFFPAEWGYPPGHPHSEERASWVRAHVIRHMQTQELRGRVTGARARSELLRKRYTPSEGTDPR